MGELDGMLERILSDPEEMKKIMGLAQSLAGESREKPPEEPLLDPGMLGKLAGLLGSASVSDDKRALVEALKPYVAQEHRGDLDRAIKIARLARVATLAMREFGGDLGGLL